MTKQQVVTFFVDKKLHTKFKVWCARKKVSMSQIIQNLIEEFLAKQ